MVKIHYVYLLTNTKPIDSRINYIGVRSCIGDPMMDDYFSSSKIIKNIIKEEGNVFNKEILKTFNTRQEAINYEIYLHKKFNVGDNEKYYNIVNQTSTKFDTTGYIFINGVKISINDYNLSLEKYHSTGKATLQNILGEKFYVDINNDNYINGELFGLNTGMVPILDETSNKFINIPKTEYNKEIHKSSNKGKVPVIDENGKTFLVNTDDENYKNGILKSVHKNKILCKNIDGRILLVTKDEFVKNNYAGINKNKVNGANNPNAKIITIFDSDDNIIKICNGNFKEICLKNKYPLNPLARSYRQNGSKLFSHLRTYPYMIEHNLEKFKGWYAIIE